MKAPKNVTLEKAKYISDYKYKFIFSNGKESIVDFKPIISVGYLQEYLDITKFKKMKVVNKYGDIYWGKDWDMCFHIDAYYGETDIRPLSNSEKKKILKELSAFC
jgi:hypothetical protein